MGGTCYSMRTSGLRGVHWMLGYRRRGTSVGLALLVGLMLFANLHDLPLTRMFHFFGSLF